MTSRWQRPSAKGPKSAQWWAHLVGALRVHPHKHYATILPKKIEDLRVVGSFLRFSNAAQALEVAGNRHMFQRTSWSLRVARRHGTSGFGTGTSLFRIESPRATSNVIKTTCIRTRPLDAPRGDEARRRFTAHRSRDRDEENGSGRIGFSEIQIVSNWPPVMMRPSRIVLRVCWFSESTLLQLTPSQTPQSARREDEGEAPEPAERPECPDEEEAPGGLGESRRSAPPSCG